MFSWLIKLAIGLIGMGIADDLSDMSSDAPYQSASAIVAFVSIVMFIAAAREFEQRPNRKTTGTASLR